MSTNLPRTLSDDQLVDEVRRLAGCERRATAALIRALVEFDARKLYLREGCSSLFTYCTQLLHLSDAAAYNRIEAARAVRRFPVVLEAIEQGKLTLTAVRLLAPHLTGANHEQVLAAAVHRSRREVEELVAALNPRPPLPNVIRRLAPSQPQRLEAHQPAAPRTSEAQAVKHAETMDAGRSLPSVDDLAHLARPASSAMAVVKPVAPEQYRLHVTLSTAAHVKLRRAQALLRHTVPSGDPAEILDRATFPRPSAAPSGAGMKAAARSWGGAAAAAKLRSSSSTTSGRTPPVVRRRWRISSFAAKPTINTKRRCSLARVRWSCARIRFRGVKLQPIAQGRL